MIDYHLIEKNKKHLESCISSRSPTPVNELYQVQEVLDPVILSKLEKYLFSVTEQQWQTVEGQEKTPRRRISWDPDTVIEELHEIFDSVTDQINEIFPVPRKYFWGISIWKDHPGYEIDWHTDNPDIDVAIQIYLYTPDGVGTLFQSSAEPVLISSKHNTGYLLRQDGNDKIPHRSESVVPAGMIRYSLYAVWSRLLKHMPNA